MANVTDDLLSFFPVLSELSIKAGAIIRRYYNAPLEVELKADNSPVTQADREVEIFLRESLEKRFPGFRSSARSSARQTNRARTAGSLIRLMAPNRSC